MKIYSLYDRPTDKGITFDDPTLTQQHFEAETNINNIIARYESTGVLGDPLNPGTIQPMFDDFSSPIDFQTAQNILAHSMQAFDQLPAHIRKRFENDPSQMLYFLEKEENRDEAIRLGLVSKPIDPNLTPIVDLDPNQSTSKT